MLKSAIRIYEILLPDERKSAMVILVYMFIGMILEMLSISMVIPMITIMLHGSMTTLSPTMVAWLSCIGYPDQKRMIIVGMLVLIGIDLVKNLFLAFLVWRQSCFAYGVQEKMSQRLFLSYLRQPYSFHLQKNSAQLIQNVTTEVNFFSSHALVPGMLLITESLVIIGVGSLLLIVEPVGALLGIMCIGASAWGFQRVSRNYITRWGVERQHHEGLRLQHLQQGLGGIKDVKLLGREGDFLSRYEEHNARSARAALNQAAFQQFPRLAIEFMVMAGLAVLVISMAVQGRDAAGILPSLGFFAMAALRLMPSVNRVLTSVQTLRFMSPAINTLHTELQSNTVLPVTGNAGKPEPFEDEIRLADVSFAYQAGSIPALRDISLTIKKGETVGLVGASGSGKSTLVDVMLGLLLPLRGQVMVDGRDIRHDVRSWQDQIGYVPQSIYLTDDTLRRNVAFGLPDDLIDDVAVESAIRAAQLGEFVRSTSDGLESMVGERGIRLSGGQRQRIGIARALYHNPAILVMDEATSALDLETEKGVMDAIAALHGEKTIIIIAHRLSTVEKCDRLYHLQQGKIVAVGKTWAGVQDLQATSA